MFVTIPAGARGVDYAFGRPPGAVLRAHGFTFAVRYISTNPSKNLTIAERDELWSARVALFLVWETSATRPQSGRAGGLEDGKKALDQAKALGYDLNVPILVAVDTDTTKQNSPTYEAYVRAFAETCKPYTIGVYGDADILIAVGSLCKLGWLPNARSWSSARRAEAEGLGLVHVYQKTGYYIESKYAVDPNDVAKPIKAWSNWEDAPIVSGRKDMPAVVHNKEVRTFEGTAWPVGAIKYAVMPDGTIRNIKEYEYASYVKYAADEVPQSNAVLDAWPVYKPAAGAAPSTVTSTVTSVIK